MNIRETVRVLLFDPQNRLLLIKVSDPSVNDPGKPWLRSPFWVTPGGRIEAGEDVFTAAHREIAEETGLATMLGPMVWRGEQVLIIKNEPTLLREAFVVARSPQAALRNQRWTAEERRVIAEMRWFSIPELESRKEVVLPPSLPELIAPIAAGNYGTTIRTIDL